MNAFSRSRFPLADSTDPSVLGFEAAFLSFSGFCVPPFGGLFFAPSLELSASAGVLVFLGGGLAPLEGPESAFYGTLTGFVGSFSVSANAWSVGKGTN